MMVSKFSKFSALGSKYVWAIEDIITRLTIIDDMLKSSGKPFLIRLN